MNFRQFAGLAATASAVLCAAAGLAMPARAHAAVSGGRYGDVAVTKPAGPMRGFVVLFSDAGGWSAADQQAADALAKAGALTVGVDTARYAARLATTSEACHQLVGDAEAVSHQLERQVQSSHYFAPIVAGRGAGATLALRILAQAPSNTIAGAVALDAQRDLDPRFKPCAPDPTVSRGNGLPGFVEKSTLGASRLSGSSQASQASQPSQSSQSSQADTALAETRQLLALVGPHLLDAVAKPEDVSDLPLVELPAAHPYGRLAIVMSGDGGWRDLDKTIAEELQKDGVSVIGWDTLRYFWSEQTPAQTSKDLARVIQTYSARWHANRIALIGYSFGADVMPFAYNRLPDAVRAKVSLISLLGFAPDADFQVRVTGWLGMPASRDALPVRPEFARLPTGIVQCFYGEHEEDTLCPALTKTGIEVIRTPGDHHFGGDYRALEKRILAGWQRQPTVQSGVQPAVAALGQAGRQTVAQATAQSVAQPVRSSAAQAGTSH